MTAAVVTRGIAAARLLDLWEMGATQTPAERALLLVRLGRDRRDDDALAKLTLGERDRELLLLRVRWFGPDFSAVERCPSCRERLELHFAATDLLVEPNAARVPLHSTAIDGYGIRFRLPDCRLAIAAASYPDVAAAHAALLTGCLDEVRHNGELVPAATVPPHVIAHVEDAMDKLDPQANVELGLRCMVCAHEWSVPFDIVAYLWDEVTAWSRQLLQEVHHLAAAYGWSEPEILALGPSRRARYLEMATIG